MTNLDVQNLDARGLKLLKQTLQADLAKTHIKHFFKLIKPENVINWHHAIILDTIQDFIDKKIKNLIISIPPQHGKFLKGDTPVLTTKGFKLHSDLQAGDYVYNDLGKPVAVIANSGIYNWHVNKVEFAGGEVLYAANEHLWKVHIEKDDKKGRRCMIIDTAEIARIKHRRSPYIQSSPCLDFEEKELPIDPYLLGVWLGDGTSGNNGLTCGVEDLAHFSQFGEPKPCNKGRVYRIGIKGLCKPLRLLGLKNNKHIPYIYFSASKEQRMELLRGLMDTDGCCDTRGRCEFTQMQGQLAKDVYLLLRTLGYKPTINLYDAKLDGRIVGQKYRITFSPQASDKIFKLQRKQERITNKSQIDRGDKYKFFINNIQPHGVVSGNCIQVEGGMYLAGESLIPTHNSEIASRVLPSYLLGLKPKCRIISASYNADNSAKFNRDVQRIIDSPEFKIAFPNVGLNSKSLRSDKDGTWLRNKDEFEIVEYGGYYKNAGIGGGITGRSADYAIIDDPVKGAADAASPTVRQSIYNWFVQDLGTRLNNKSQKLIIMTRWHEQDLVGMLLSNPQVAKHWHVLSLPALREDMHDSRDPRKIGEAMWEDFQGIERLNEARALGERFFQCLYQQNPKANRDVLVYPDFEVIEDALYSDLAKIEIFGLDFGFNDELALVGTKLHDNQLFLKEYIYEKGLTPDALVTKLKALGVRMQLLVCDNARPELITHLRGAGFNAVACEKGAGSVYTGIQIVKAHSIHITRASSNLITEAQNYEWITDGMGFATEVPKGKKDHALDSVRYATVKQVQIRRGSRPAKYLDMTRR